MQEELQIIKQEILLLVVMDLQYPLSQMPKICKQPSWVVVLAHKVNNMVHPMDLAWLDQIRYLRKGKDQFQNLLIHN